MQNPDFKAVTWKIRIAKDLSFIFEFADFQLSNFKIPCPTGFWTRTNFRICDSLNCEFACLLGRCANFFTKICNLKELAGDRFAKSGFEIIYMENPENKAVSIDFRISEFLYYRVSGSLPLSPESDKFRSVILDCGFAIVPTASWPNFRANDFNHLQTDLEQTQQSNPQ